MFVDNIQNVYGPNGVIPSTVRAYLVEEEVREFRAEVMYCGWFAGAFEPTFKFFELLAHREFGATFSEIGKNPLNRLEPRIVQSAIKVVDNVSHHQGNVSESCRIGKLMYHAFCSELRVNFNPENIGFMKRKNTCVDVIDMLIGPFNFQFGVSEGIE
jgi:hypothetical protein